MSFALEFRRKHFLEPGLAAKAQDRFKGRSGVVRRIPPVGHRVGEEAERSPARRVALVALLIAAGILAVFNSEGMVTYARDLAESRMGRPLLPVAERWDGAMDRIGAKWLVASVRGVMLDAQYAGWSDMAGLFGLANDPMTAERPADEELYTGALPEKGR